jgi:hypothetical protein
MTDKFIRCIVLGQLILFVFLLICLVLMPHFLFESNEGGISNYGLYARTVVPYSLAFGLCGLLTLKAAYYVPRHIAAYQALRVVLAILGVLFIAVLVSTYPYKINNTFGNIHAYIGLAFTVWELLLGIWFGLFLARNFKNLLLLLVEWVGFVFGILTHANVIHILFIAEILTTCTFGILLMRTSRLLADQET